MTISVRSALVLREIVSRTFKSGAGPQVLSTFDTQATSLRRVANFILPFSLTASPAADYASSPTSTVISNTITALVSGGRGPYSYVWTVQSYTASTPPSLSTPTLASLYAVQSGVPLNALRSAVLQCVATDFYGSTATVTVSVEFERANNS